jgi:hypothetical protein
MAAHLSSAGARAQQAGEHPHRGCFPGAIRTEQPEDFPRLDGKGEVLHSQASAETLAEAVDLEARRHSMVTSTNLTLRFLSTGVTVLSAPTA